LASRGLMAPGGIDPLVLTGLMFTSPAIGLALAIPARAPDFSLGGEAWGWALAAAVASAAIPVGLFYTGVRRAGAAAAGLLSTAEPLVSVLLAYAVLGESLGALQLVGGGLILISVAALALE